MRTTCRLFLAALLVMAVAGAVSAQDGGAAPPSTAPEPVVTPVPALPPIPAAQSGAPAVEPAVPVSPDAVVPPEPPADPSSAPAVEPAVVPAVNPPAPEKLPDGVVTTRRVRTKKTVKKVVEMPASKEAESTETAAAVVSTAAADSPGNAPPPPGVAASTVPIAPPPAPAAEASGVVNAEAAPSPREMGTGGWILFALVVVALFGIITLIRNRRPRSRTSIVDHETPSPEMQPALVLSPKPALAPRP